MHLGGIDNKEKSIMNLNNEVSDAGITNNSPEQEARMTGGDNQYRDLTT